MRCTVDEEGRVAIPEPIREDLQLGPGSVLEIVEEHGELLLKPVEKKDAEAIRILAGEATDEDVDERAQSLALSMVKEPVPDGADRQEAVAYVRSLRRRLQAKYGETSDSTDLIREDRDR